MYPRFFSRYLIPHLNMKEDRRCDKSKFSQQKRKSMLKDMFSMVQQKFSRILNDPGKSSKRTTKTRGSSKKTRGSKNKQDTCSATELIMRLSDE